MSPAIVTVVTSRAQVEGGLTLFLPLHTCARGNNGNNRALLHEAQHRPGPQSRAALWLPREGEGHPPTGAHRCTKGGRRTFGAPCAPWRQGSPRPFGEPWRDLRGLAGGCLAGNGKRVPTRCLPVACGPSKHPHPVRTLRPFEAATLGTSSLPAAAALPR